MLAILYLTGIVTSIIVPIFKYREEYKNALISASISIFCGIMYAILLIYKAFTNPFELDFWIIFGFLSLVFWIFAFLSNNSSYCLIYIFTAFLISGLWCIFFQNPDYLSYSVPCNINHNYVETIPIVSTYDGSEFGESIFGDGFVVGVFRKSHVKGRIFKYYYLTNDGIVKPNKISENRVEITYIGSDEEPYVEISYTVKCSGYRNISKTHNLRTVYQTYHFYIPENSITSIPAEDY